MNKSGNSRYNLGISIPFQEYDGESEVDYGKTFELAYGIDTKLNNNLTISTILGVSKETESFLGSKGSGAYNLDDSSTHTKYLGVKLHQKISSYTDFEFHGIIGKSDLYEIKESLITGIDNVITSSASFKVSKLKIFADDHMSISLFQPTRIEKGKMKINLVDEYDNLGNISFKEYSVDIKPSGRQIDTVLDYGVNLKSGINLKIKGIY